MYGHCCYMGWGLSDETDYLNCRCYFLTLQTVSEHYATTKYSTKIEQIKSLRYEVFLTVTNDSEYL